MRRYTRLADPQFLPDTTPGVIYRNSNATKTYIAGFILHNADGATRNAQLWNVPNSGTADGSPTDVRKFLDKDLLAGETYVLSFPYPITLIDNFDTIQGLASQVNSINIQILGDLDD